VTLSLTHRQNLLTALAPIVGAEAAEALLSQYPTTIGEEPVTRDILRAETADLRAETADLRADMAELRTDFADLRAEFADLRAEFADLRAEVRSDIAGLRVEMHEGFARLTTWGTGALLGGLFGGLSVGMALAAAIG